MHRIIVSQVIPDVGQIIVVEGEEAEHAVRVKRVEVGEPIQLIDGAGVVAEAVVEGVSRMRGTGKSAAGPEVQIRVQTRHAAAFPGVQPQVEVFTATPKGGRVDEMIDALSQVGVATWAPLETARGVVDPRENKLARLERIAREAAKQCGRSWILRIGASATLARALSPTDGGEAGPLVVFADATGEAWGSASNRAGGRPIRLLIGPEGGWTNDEVAAAKSAGALITRFGPHTMRIEVAAVAACAVIMATGRAVG